MWLHKKAPSAKYFFPSIYSHLYKPHLFKENYPFNRLVHDKLNKNAIEQYQKEGIPFPKGATSYYQRVPAEFMNKDSGENLPDSENIWAFISSCFFFLFGDEPNGIS